MPLAKLEQWFPDDDEARPRSAHGVHFKPGKTVAGMFHARAHSGLGRVDDPYTFERQEAMWSDAKIDAVLRGDDPAGGGGKGVAARSKGDVQRDAELKWCARHGIRADAWQEVRALYYDCRGGRLPPEKLARLPDSMLLPLEQRTKGALAKAARKQPLLGKSAFVGYTSGAGGGPGGGAAGAGAAMGATGPLQEELKATMRLKVTQGGGGGGKKKAAWRDQYYILDPSRGTLRAFDTNWPCDEAALKHEIDLRGRLEGCTSPRWLDDESEIRFQLTPLAKVQFAQCGGEDAEVVLKARTKETALLWVGALRAVLADERRKQKKKKKDQHQHQNAGGAKAAARRAARGDPPVHPGRARVAAWVPAEEQSPAERRHARSKAAAQLGGTQGRHKFSVATVYWCTLLASLLALVLLPVALASTAWVTMRVAAPWPPAATSSLNGTAGTAAAMAGAVGVGATRVEAGLFALGCETAAAAPAVPSCRRTLLLRTMPAPAPAGGALPPLLARQRHALVAECSGAAAAVADPAASAVVAGGITAGGAAAATRQDSLVRGSCSGGWRATQVLGVMSALPPAAAFLGVVAHGYENERIMLWLGLLLGAGALFGGLALLVWAVVLHGRMAAAFLGADGAAAAAARLGTGFWCCLFGSGAAAAGAVLCWWQIRDVTWRVTPGLHSADDVLSAMPKHAFHAGETSWAMPKRHDSDSDEETEVITIN
jgi:hypothetical protein